MQTDLIIIEEYCRKSQLDPTFLQLLESVGLLDVYSEHDGRYISVNQLPQLEQYVRLYYDLSINIEGIDAIQHLVQRITELQKEVNDLKNRLRLYE